MMENHHNLTEVEQFVDSRDELCSVSDSNSECSEGSPRSRLHNCALGYEFWTKEPDSVDERREKFLKWMGLSSDWHTTANDGTEDFCFRENKMCRQRLEDYCETVLANLNSEPQYFSSQSSISFDSTEKSEDGANEEELTWKIKNLDNGTEFVVDELSNHGTLTTLREVGSEKMVSLEEFQRKFCSSALVQRFLQKDCQVDSNMVDTKKKVKTSWRQKLSTLTHNTDRSPKFQWKCSEMNSKSGTGSRRVRVHVCRKHSKELSSLYSGQEFSAHEGSISTMKFSPDGQYLASGGEDGIVRVWKVLQDESLSKIDIQDMDPSCLYFSLKDLSEIDPLFVDKEKTSYVEKTSPIKTVINLSKLASPSVDKEKIGPIASLKKSSESACVVVPPKVFQLLEKPLHEFHGHGGEVLALSWSRNGHLLSSSVDKTARLWKVGNDQCLGIYEHNNYVTCIEFNPVDENYFISGSLDGKIRIWEVEGCRVIDWTDIREIVTAVCYSPDGKGGMVGSMDGNCRFYDVIDNRLQLGDQICLKGKKKLTGKRITGFQFCPSDSSKVMVTSADSKVRILSGTNIICKFKGNRSSASQVPASFTSDGQHIVSAADDSNIRVWSYTAQDQKSSRSKTIKSCESFLSRNASIAVPWCGLKKKLGSLPVSILGNGHFDDKLLPKVPTSFPDCFTTSLGFFLDAISKGSPTWPEEKLPKSSPGSVMSSMCKSEFKFLKNAWQNALSSPHLWGLVIVTASWDGCIRTFLNYGLPIRL